MNLAAATEPRIVGRYSIYGEIASGGMASVHFARLAGPSGFGRTVAVKRAHPHLAKDKDFALMFMDEARLASRIRHSNVVSTIDVLSTANELLLVMDYVHGESLWRLLRLSAERNERIPVPIAAAIMIDTLHGLHAAHEANDERGEPLGIVHRDVSPHNILVGVDGISRIVDFGIAKAAGRLHSTRDSSVKGKYAYMAPEQVRGDPVSRLTDTYAAAIVFWELVTGQRLFVGKTEAETIHKCLVARVQPPSLFAPELGTGLDEILRRALSREPSRRYQTAREMALDIESCVAAIRPSEVGAWVERTAHETLAERAAILAEIEQGNSPDARGGAGEAGAPGSQSVTWVIGPGGGQTGVRAHGNGEATPQSARTIGPLTDTAAPARSRSKKVALLPALITVVAIAGVVALLAVRAGPSAANTTAAAAREAAAHEAPKGEADPSAASPAPRLVAATPPPSQPVAPSTGQAPTVAAPAAVAAPDAPPKPSVALSPARPTQRSTPRSSRTKRASCDPPYSVDAQGTQIFKPECM